MIGLQPYNTMLYNISFNPETGVLRVGFGEEQSSNDKIIVEAKDTASALVEQVAGTPVLRVNGPASLPVAMMLAHTYAHVVGAVACFDPKLGGYVVAISHSPDYTVGQVVE